jgi:hypothetical protein
VLKLEMERLSLSRGDAAQRDRPTVERLERLVAELSQLRSAQKTLTDQWEGEKSELSTIQMLKEEVERVGFEVAQVRLPLETALTHDALASYASHERSARTRDLGSIG